MTIEELNKNAQGLASLAFVIGLVLVMLGKFGQVSGITTEANTAITSFITGIGGYADWVGIIVLIGVGGYLLMMFKKKTMG
jgi:hypothetical protein